MPSPNQYDYSDPVYDDAYPSAALSRPVQAGNRGRSPKIPLSYSAVVEAIGILATEPAELDPNT